MKWYQGGDRSGSLISIPRRAGQSAGIKSVPFYVQLAVDEPRDGFRDGARVWFLGMASRTY